MDVITMFSTLRHLPNHIRTYKQALDWYNQTKPIRGRESDVRPLGDRRDVDKFSIRVNADGDVEMVLYRTPVLTWRKPKEGSPECVTVYFGNWTSAFTAYFIRYMLPNCTGVSNSKNRVVITMLGSGRKIVMKANEKVRFTNGEDGFFVPVKDDLTPNVQWTIDKKAAHKVRAKYKPFTDYVRSCLSLMRHDVNDDIVRLDRTFIADYITSPPSVLTKCHRTRNDLHKTEYLRNWQSLIESGEAEDWSTAMRMFLSQQSEVVRIYWRLTSPQYAPMEHVFVGVRKSMKELDETLLRLHAYEVLTLKTTKDGQVPSNKYDDWALGPAAGYKT